MPVSLVTGYAAHSFVKSVYIGDSHIYVTHLGVSVYNRHSPTIVQTFRHGSQAAMWRLLMATEAKPKSVTLVVLFDSKFRHSLKLTRGNDLRNQLSFFDKWKHTISNHFLQCNVDLITWWQRKRGACRSPLYSKSFRKLCLPSANRMISLIFHWKAALSVSQPLRLCVFILSYHMNVICICYRGRYDLHLSINECFCVSSQSSSSSYHCPKYVPTI